MNEVLCKLVCKVFCKRGSFVHRALIYIDTYMSQSKYRSFKGSYIYVDTYMVFNKINNT